MNLVLEAMLTAFLAAGGDAKAGALLREAEAAWAAGDRKDALRLADEAVEKHPKHPPVYALRAGFFEKLEHYDKAIADWTRFIDLEPKFASAYQQRGVAHFKAGKIAESIKDFDKYIELEPKAKISHWQRGISYYYAGRHDDGMAQFEGYQEFDGNDVENAVWRFMCQAKKEGLAKARKDILKIGDDRRVPMRQIYDMFLEKLTPEEVIAIAVKTNAKDKTAVSRQLFYAHLYVGIYVELQGKKEAALEHLNKATEEHRIGHYMWDVARVHGDILRAELKK